MKPNVGKCDRIVRGAAGAALIVLAALWANLWSIPLGIVGLALVLSASFGICFAYRACGIDTACRIENPKP
jgi:hypothetical protein